MMVFIVLFMGLVFVGIFIWVSGVILFVVFVVILWDVVCLVIVYCKFEDGICVVSLVEDEEDLEGLDLEVFWWKICLFLVLGLIGLFLGVDLLVDSGIEIVCMFCVFEIVIGFMLIVIGISLFEFVIIVMVVLCK